MNIKLAIQGSTDKESVQNIIAISYRIANSLYGQNTSRVLNLDGATSIIRVVEDSATIIISSESGGVFIHPRAGNIELMTHYEWESYQGIGALVQKRMLYGVAGGWSNGKTELTTDYIYPLIDEDNASYTLFKEDGDSEIEGEFSGDSGNYGNLYWWNGSEEEPVFLSWKGTPSRHFRLPSTISIDGFTIQETASPGLVEDTPFFTSFGQHIYQDGSILITAPRYNWPYRGQDRCFVLGAAQDTEGTVWAVMQSDRYYVPRYIAIFSDGHRITGEDHTNIEKYLSDNEGITIVFEKEYETKKGIYTVLWKTGGPIDGWTLVAEWNTGRVGLPWFGNTVGSEFVCSDGTIITKTGGYTEPSSSQGTIIFSNGGAHVCSTGSIKMSATDKHWAEFAENTLLSSNAVLNFTSLSSITLTKPRVRVYTGSFGILYNPDDPSEIPVPLTLTQSSLRISVGSSLPNFTVGGRGGSTMSISGFTLVDGIVTSAGCGMGSITVTDGCGDSVTIPVYLPTGYWKTVSTIYATCGGPTPTSPYWCTTTPCAPYSVPPPNGCGYVWLGWAAAGYPSNPAVVALYNEENDLYSNGGLSKLWRFGASATTTSTLGTTNIGAQRWVVVSQVQYEWTCP